VSDDIAEAAEQARVEAERRAEEQRRPRDYEQEWQAAFKESDMKSGINPEAVTNGLNDLDARSPITSGEIIPLRPHGSTDWKTPDPEQVRERLSLEFWENRKLPPLDPLMGELVTTTSRILLVGPTGLGKTNFLVALGMSIADGDNFLHWSNGGNPRRVLYIDGEMSRRLFKARLADAVRRHGNRPETFFAFSREDFEDLPPIDTEAGQKYVDSIITALGGVDLIIPDNLQALTLGDLREPESWRKVNPWTRELTARHIGQIWVQHTGLDETHAYGDKTRKWGLDTVIMMEHADRPETDIAFELKFPKARERTPENRLDFKQTVITLINDKWESGNLPGEAKQRGRISPKGMAFLDGLINTLAKCGQPRPESGECPSVRMGEWQAECVNRGLLDNAKPHSLRTMLSKYRLELIGAGKVICNGEVVWKL
jgi:hypothetical protein